MAQIYGFDEVFNKLAYCHAIFQVQPEVWSAPTWEMASISQML